MIFCRNLILQTFQAFCCGDQREIRDRIRGSVTSDTASDPVSDFSLITAAKRLKRLYNQISAENHCETLTLLCLKTNENEVANLR